MSCTCLPNCSPFENEAESTNSQINQDIQIEKLKLRSEVRLLLLGQRNSGISTFIKHLGLLHGLRYSEDERRAYINVIHRNLIVAVCYLIKAMKSMSFSFENTQNDEFSNMVMNLDLDGHQHLSPTHFEALGSLWCDPGIRKVYKRRQLYLLTDSSRYYFDDITRISDKDYLPTDEDILRAKVVSTSLTEYLFKINHLNIRLIDVGSQSNKHRKWIHFFDDALSIMFFVAMDEYDIPSRRNKIKTRLDDSMDLFQGILRYKEFQSKTFILLLNKIDNFAEKLKSSDLVTYYPDFEGQKNNCVEGRRFILHKLLSLNENPDRTIFYNYACATDEKSMKVVIKAVKECILASFMRTYSIS